MTECVRCALLQREIAGLKAELEQALKDYCDDMCGVECSCGYKATNVINGTVIQGNIVGDVRL